MSSKKVKNPFGVKDWILIHISELTKEQTWKNCNCTCSSCWSPLVAKLGDFNIHHFAHYDETSCGGSLESDLHKFAKELILKEKTIKLPSYKDKIHKINIDEKEIVFEKVDLEKQIHDFKPDIVWYYKNSLLLIEIAVTHFIGDAKYKKIKESQISCIEIDLSKSKDYIFDLEKLKNIILHDISNKTWIYSYLAEELKNKFLIDYSIKVQESEQKKKKAEEELNQEIKKIQEKYKNISPYVYLFYVIILLQCMIEASFSEFYLRNPTFFQTVFTNYYNWKTDKEMFLKIINWLAYIKGKNEYIWDYSINKFHDRFYKFFFLFNDSLNKNYKNIEFKVFEQKFNDLCISCVTSPEMKISDNFFVEELKEAYFDPDIIDSEVYIFNLITTQEKVKFWLPIITKKLSYKQNRLKVYFDMFFRSSDWKQNAKKILDYINTNFKVDNHNFW